MNMMNFGEKNVSNEFYLKNLNEELTQSVNYKDLISYNQIPKTFLNKERVIKEQPSVGGFKIHQENLKKFVSPNEFYKNLVGKDDLYKSEYSTTFNKQLSSNSRTDGFNNIDNRNLYNQTGNFKNSNNDDFLNNLNQDAPLTDNLLNVFENEVKKLKNESEMYMNKNSNNNVKFKEIKEEKVINNYLVSNPDRMQMIKHVTTNYKDEYLSLEEIQKQREEHMALLVNLENEYYNKKKLGNELENDLKQSIPNSKNQDMNNSNFNYKEIDDFLKNEEIEFQKNRLKKVKHRLGANIDLGLSDGKRRNRTVQKLRKYRDNKPLNNYESKYVKSFMNYLLKRKYQINNETEFLQTESWNKTKVRSSNSKAINTTKEGLPGRLDVGHVDKKDYSMYYLSIDSDSPRSLSLKSGSFREFSGVKQNRRIIKAEQKRIASPIQYGSSQGKYSRTEIDTNYRSEGFSRTGFNSNSNYENNDINENNLENPSYQSQLTFIRMIFHILDYDKKGYITKESLNNSLGLDPKILEDLGFQSENEFLEGLMSFQTSVENVISEEEFVGYLLSHSSHNEQFLHNFINKKNNWDALSENYNKTSHSGMKNTKYSNLVNYEGEVFNNENQERNYDFNNRSLNNLLSNSVTNFKKSNNNIDFSHLNKEKNDNLIKSQLYSKWNENINKYNISKSAKFMMNLKRSIVSQKLNLSYNDYKEFIIGFKPKKELNVTIPIPPSFYDKKGKKEAKIKQIIEERKKEEDEILGYRFKANELKREIFISQFENIIVAERERRKYRCEKLKQKIIQNMKPFSFYDCDEKKYKERLEKECNPQQFLPFKANPIPWTSQVNLYEDMLTKQADERKQRVEERARQNYSLAKLPPRMEMHEKRKKIQDEEMKGMEGVKYNNRSKSFRV